jgi:3-hydroxyisobutyrate dehydrogenase
MHDVRKDVAAPILETGAVWAESLGHLTEQCDVMATCLPGPVEMEAVTMGPDGILEKIRHDTIYIDHTTNSP